MLCKYPKLKNFFPPNSNPLDKFKFVKIVTIFPITYSYMAIKGNIIDDSIGNALQLISKKSRPLWIKLILEWSKQLAEFVANNPRASVLLPPLKSNQNWASQATIPNHGLTKDKEEDWKAIDTIRIQQTPWHHPL